MTGQVRSVSSAVVLNHKNEAGKIGRVVELLDHFGVAVKLLEPAEFLDDLTDPTNSGSKSNKHLVATIAGLGLLEELIRESDLRDVTEMFRGTFLFGLDSDVRSDPILPACLKSLRGGIRKAASGTELYRVSDCQKEICGPMSGLSIDSTLAAAPSLFGYGSTSESVDPIIFCDDGWLFARIPGRASELFVATSEDTVELGAEQRANLQTSNLVSELLPFLLWIRYAFAGSCWEASICGANLIIDDPLLKPTYGFLDLSQLLDLVGPDFAATIGFIPCNHKRTNPIFAEQVRRKYPWFSICVHGCFHSRGEFGSRPESELNELAWLARQGMEKHRELASIPFENIMVFPQGIFTKKALRCLRRAGYLAAINTEVRDNACESGVELRELLQPAVLCHGGTPLLTRRNVTDDISSFALDLLIGKPCLLVAHHDFFREGMSSLISLLSALNSLSAPLSWTNLESILRQNYWTRENGSNEYSIIAAS